MIKFPSSCCFHIWTMIYSFNTIGVLKQAALLFLRCLFLYKENRDESRRYDGKRKCVHLKCLFKFRKNRTYTYTRNHLNFQSKEGSCCPNSFWMAIGKKLSVYLRKNVQKWTVPKLKFKSLLTLLNYRIHGTLVVKKSCFDSLILLF